MKSQKTSLSSHSQKASQKGHRLWSLFEQSEWLAQKQQMDRDLYVARQLQQSLLPRSLGESIFEDE